MVSYNAPRPTDPTLGPCRLFCRVNRNRRPHLSGTRRARFSARAALPDEAADRVVVLRISYASVRAPLSNYKDTTCIVNHASARARAWLYERGTALIVYVGSGHPARWSERPIRSLVRSRPTDNRRLCPAISAGNKGSITRGRLMAPSEEKKARDTAREWERGAECRDCSAITPGLSHHVRREIFVGPMPTGDSPNHFSRCDTATLISGK